VCYNDNTNIFAAEFRDLRYENASKKDIALSIQLSISENKVSSSLDDIDEDIAYIVSRLNV
jgi:hypothetical protein